MYERGSSTLAWSGWRDELKVLHRQRRSVFFVLALVIVISAFWTNGWAYVGFFAILALYSLWAHVRLGFVVGLSFSIWFTASRLGWVQPGGTGARIFGMWAIGMLFLLVVWKADGVAELRDRPGGSNAPHD